MRDFESRSLHYSVIWSILACSSFHSESRRSLSNRLAVIKNKSQETYRYGKSHLHKLKSDVVKIFPVSLSLSFSLSLPPSLLFSLLYHTSKETIMIEIAHTYI